MLSRGNICPHCGKPFGGIRFGLTFGPVAVLIIDIIDRAGPDGIDHDKLFEIVYRGRNAKRTALKSYICWINERLRESDVHIAGMRGNGGRYRITKYKPRNYSKVRIVA